MSRGPFNLRPIDELLLGLSVLMILEMRRAGDAVAQVKKLAAKAAADPTLWERIKDNAADTIIQRLLFK